MTLALRPAGGLSSRAWRVVGLAVAVLTVGLFAAGMAVYYRQLQMVCTAQPCYSSPTPEQARVLAAAGISLRTAASFVVGLTVLCAAVHVAVAAVIVWRRPADRMAWLTALALLTFGTFGVQDTATVTGVMAAFHPVWRVLALVLLAGASVSITVFYFVFPNGHFVPRWLRWPVALLCTWQILIALFPATLVDPGRWPLFGMLAYWGAIFGSIATVQVYRYRRVSTYEQRQQSKWAVFGITTALSGALAALLLTGVLAPALGPRWAPLALALNYSYYPFLTLVPLSIGVAILRSHLYDIDVVIRRTLVYSVFTGLLALAYFSSVLVLQSVLRALTGQQQSSLVTVLSTLAIAALFFPLRARVQAFIDRRFYRQTYNAARTLAAFGAALRDETDLEQLSRQLVQVVDQSMQPAHVSLWLRPRSHSERGANQRQV